MRDMPLLIFDVDGTLVDSQDVIVEAQKRTFAAHGLTPPDRATSLSVVGLSLREAFEVLAGPDAPIDSLAEHFSRRRRPRAPRRGDIAAGHRAISDATSRSAASRG